MSTWTIDRHPGIFDPLSYLLDNEPRDIWNCCPATWYSWEKRCCKAGFSIVLCITIENGTVDGPGEGRRCMFISINPATLPRPSVFLGGPLRWTHLHTTSKATSQKELNRCNESPNSYQLYQKVFFTAFYLKLYTYLYNLKRCAIAALSGIFGNLVAKIIAIEESG